MIDLHMHSIYSDDGQFTPQELAEQCAACGVEVMAVTDHNSAKANREAEETARKRGVRYITGIEIDCTYEGADFHMLGYGIDDASPDFAKVEENIRSQVREASAIMLAKTRELGFWVEEEELNRLSGKSLWPDSWTGEMFAEILLAKPEYQDHPMLLPYREGGSRSSHITTGRPVRFTSISLNSKDFSARSPRVLFIFLGSPSTSFVTWYSFTSSSSRARVCRSLFSDFLLIISTGWAVMPKGSLTATPRVLEPKSSPIIRISCSRLFL